ncbi:Digestive organ expansion factor [Macleaya cordata]|uniref:Digestive organ expansion factor n=1 Tax=Macleaya cordata TaxID=56857 RepID=A0A200R4G4_MACCD|nr:Digestive organ expansion factor [Macleaya cordata]
MARPNGRNRGLKRHKSPEMTVASKQSRKNGRTDRKVARSPSPSSSGNSSEEEPTSSVASEEIVVHKEPSMYDNLLRTLGSSSDSFANFYKRRQREEEGKSDTEEDEDGHSTSSSLSEGENESDEEGSESSDNVSDRSNSMEADLQKPTQSDLMEQSEEDETENDDETSDTDQEDDLEVKGQIDVDASKITSSFNDHLGHKLSKAEVDDLSKKKWKFKWEVPAVDISMSKWIGTGECFLKDVDSSSGYDLKHKLYKHWLDVYKKAGGNDFHSSRQRRFFTLCNSYRDILHCNKKPFYLKGPEEDSGVMDAYIMHALNHVFRTRDVVTKNEAKLAKHPENIKEENDEGFLDHGFTRPKVLILLPLASIALRVVKRLIQLTPSSHKVNVEYTDRFLDEFGVGEVDKNELSNGVDDGETSKSQKSSKPSDFQALFGGNNNDHFMIGIKFTRRSIKLYSDFYSSDIIVASPLGLITKFGEAEVEKEKDVDYLSSIESYMQRFMYSCVVTVQNWSHVNTVVENLNHIPSKLHGTDVMRIRKWYLDGYAKFYRQTILLGSFPNPDINALFNQLCVNYQGKVKLLTEYKGVLPKVLLQVRQVYERFDSTSIVDASDARLDYFVKKVSFNKLSWYIGLQNGGTMLFISSYFEFVRIRNFLKSQNASFCMLGEYTKQSDISRARVWFFEGKRKIMLYTERAHFYHRYKIRGIKNLIIYSLPERKEFYPEIVNMLEGSENMTCTVLFSRLDQLRLERIVGSTASKRLMSSEKSIFVFC